MSSAAPGPLAGLRVIDLSTFLPGPFASMLLADYGADVIKVEGPGLPDPMRALRPPVGPAGSHRATVLNRNKRCVSIDLKADAGRDLLLELCRTSDVLVEGFRPGVATRLGIGYEAVRAANARIVYCSITGYGQSGPHAARPGHDINFVGAAGMGAYLGIDADYHGAGIPLGDIAGGSMMALFGIQAALYARERTGVGSHVDVAIVDGLASWHAARIDGYESAPLTSPSPRRPGYGVYAAGDGLLLSLGCLEPKFWRALRGVLADHHELPFVQPEDSMEARAAVASAMATRDRDEWLAIFDDAGVPAAPVLGLNELADDAQLAARGVIRDAGEADGSHLHTVSPVKFDGAGGAIHRPASAPGEDTDDVLLGAGLAPERIAELRVAGVID